MLAEARAQIARLRGNAFASAVSVLVGGAASAHAITALALPILSRLYTPAEFSVLAIFNSLIAVISAAACLRYDVAVAIPEDDGDAYNMLLGAVGIAAVVAATTLAVAVAFPIRIASMLNHPEMASMLWLLGFAVFLAATASALQNWFIRAKEFRQIAQSRIAQSTACVVAQIGAGLRGAGPSGLVVGAILNTGASAVYLGWCLIARRSKELTPWSVIRIQAILREYIRFPRFSAFEALCNSASIQLPILMIGAFATGPEAGYLLLAMSAMQAPTALFGIAIGQVYLSQAPIEHRGGKLADFTERSVELLVKAGVGPLLFAGIAAPWLFGPVFGANWSRAGVIVAWMTPWFIMQFVTSPVSMALHVTGNQRSALHLQIFGLLARVGAVWGVAHIDSRAISESYALSGLLMYGVYYVVVMRRIGARSIVLFQAVRRNWRIIGIWIALATVVVGAVAGVALLSPTA